MKKTNKDKIEGLKEKIKIAKMYCLQFPNLCIEYERLLKEYENIIIKFQNKINKKEYHKGYAKGWEDCEKDVAKRQY